MDDPMPPLENLDAWLLRHAEAVTYVVFFGLFVILAAAELVVSRSSAPAERVRRWSTNVVLTVCWIAAGAALPMTLFGAAAWAGAAGWGLQNQFDHPIALTLVLGILARSLVSYAVHVAMHKVPLLWRLHRVHHLDTHLDVSTTTRMHPLEAWASAPLTVAGVVALGIPPTAVLLYEILDAAVVVFTHANIRLPPQIDRAIGIVFVTPDLHRVHHSALQPDTDSNYGATLSLWDRLFGTYRRRNTEDLATLRIGLDGATDERAQHIGWLLASPWHTISAVPSNGSDHG